MISLLREAASDISQGFGNTREKLKKIANTFLNSNLMSAQEAAYHVLSLPLSKSSRSTVFINTSRINDRVMILKPKSMLKDIDCNSSDIFMSNIFDKYAKRPAALEKICLADFASNYSFNSNNKNEGINDDEDIENIRISERKKKKILRYRNYKILTDPEEYYRERILLFVPWRKEMDEVENINHHKTYNKHKDEIKQNSIPYCSMPENVLEEAINTIQNEIQNIEEEEIEDFYNDELPRHYKINILDQGGQEKPSPDFNRYTTPQKIQLSKVNEILQKLNEKQSIFVKEIYERCKSKKTPFHIFLSGSADVGKSTVINALFQLLSHYYDNTPGSNGNSIKVLLTAPSGKAAFLIRGVTLHTAFALPVSQFGGQMPELSNEIANTIREKLCELKVLIIDEISMVGSTLLSRVDTRMRQITGKNDLFGGISVIVVGDLNQLPPVMDSLVFQPPKNSELSLFCVTNPIWDNFKIFELTEIMRQKNEKEFIIALNNLVQGTMTNEDINLFKSREVKEEEVPKDTIRLFYENSNVEEFNNLKISGSKAEEFQSEAVDMVLGKVNEKIKMKALENIKKKKTTETGGLTSVLRLKVGIKYMITTNIDVEDGLVNGTCGVLQKVSLKSQSRIIDKLWLSFLPDETVGRNARAPFLNYMLNEGIDANLVPITQAAFQLD